MDRKRAGSIMFNIVEQINTKMGGINFYIDFNKILYGDADIDINNNINPSPLNIKKRLSIILCSIYYILFLT